MTVWGRVTPPRTAVRVIDLAVPLAPITDAATHDRVRVYVLHDGRPIGRVDVVHHGQPIGTDRLRDAIAAKLATPLLERLLAAGLAADSPLLDARVPVSIVVATRDRPRELAGCLAHLRQQETARPLEIVVVDNNPLSGLTPPVVAAHPGIVLVSEPRRGLAYARNAGFLAARGEVLACTDDDVTTPPGWLEALVAPFADARVAAVTGNVLPLELETPAQWHYEAYGGLGRGFTRRVVDGEWFRAHRGAVPTWDLGATANAAVRASALREPAVGLMDEALGPGMPSGVGEDTYLFYRLLRANTTLVYEPRAWVWHRHRRDMSALRRQMYAYSTGHVAYHLTTWLRDGDRRALVRVLLRLPAWHLRQLRRWAIGRLRGRVVHPLDLVLIEIAGHVAGPWCLWRSRRRVRREGRSGATRPAAPTGGRSPGRFVAEPVR